MLHLRAGEPLGLDQGLFACFGRWLRDGWLPYRDIFDSKPPLQLYTWVLAWAGGSAAWAWWFEALWLAATMVVAGCVARRWWPADRAGGDWAGLAAAALVLAGLWAPSLGGYAARLQAEELLALPVLGAAWCAIAALTRPRAAIACGVLVGIAALYKVPALAIGVPWLVLWAAGLPRRAALGRAAGLCAGVLAPWLAACAYFAARGALGVFLGSVFVYQRYWIAVLDPPWHDVLHGFLTTAAGALAPLWIAAAAGIAIAWRRDRARAIALAAWLAATAIAVVLQRQLAGYHFLLLVPGLAIAGGHGVAALGPLAARAGRGVRLAAVAALVAIAALAVPAARAWARAYGATDPHAYAGGTFHPAEEEQVARFVAAHTRASDGMLVWALAPGIYALADRHPTTRWPFHKLLLTDAPFALAVPGRAARRAAFLARLRADPPAMIVVGVHDENPFEPQDSAASLFAFAELGQLVLRDYHEVTRTAHFVVLARAPAAPP